MFTLDETRPVWAEINLDNLAHNIKEVRKYVDKNALVMAVIKANGYGHGAVEISRTFLDNGADRLAIAILSEGIELRRGNITESILILGYTPPTLYKKVIEYNLIQTIYNYEDAEILSNIAVELNKRVTIHIKIDSGMCRLGFLPNEKSIEDIVKISKLPNIYIEGIFTHFAKADEIDKSYTKKQFEVFTHFIDELDKNGLTIPIKHASNSAGIIDFPYYNLNMVRAGIMLYGYYPSDEVKKDNIELKPAMTLKAKVSHIKIIPEGTGVSYGQIFVADRETKIATLPIGYADGFTRIFNGKAEVYINGKMAKVLGKICMDQCMIDVTDIDDVEVGNEAVLFGYGEEGYPHVDEVARKIGTINYEIVCMVSRRVPRVYITNGSIVKIRDYIVD